jgi:DNA-binding Xre family transcriptional regulator
MLQLNIGGMARMYGAEHVQAFLIERGLSAREARTVTHPTEVRQVRDSLLQRLCEGLLCTPNDVFRWTGVGESHLHYLNVGDTPSLALWLRGVRDPKEVERLMLLAQKLYEEEEVPMTRMHGGRMFINVRRLLEQRGVKKLHRELKWMGFTHGEAAGLLSDKRVAIKLPLLTKVCVAFKCMPNDIYDFAGPEGHVLNAVRKAPVVAIDARLAGLTQEQLRKVLWKVING